MKVKLVSHASVIITTEAGGIWTDPWLVGKAFNDSWALWPKPAYDPAMLEDIAYIWISHEHPDHFSIPTLKSLPNDFKERVHVLFQEKNSDKIFDAMRKMGFQHFLALPNRKSVALTTGVIVNCRQISFIDSALSVTEGITTIVNINDCDVSETDVRRILGDVGQPKLVLTQFSLAGYDGYNERERILPRLAQQKIETMIRTHRLFRADATVPFASFSYFCTADNHYMNGYGNTIGAVERAFAEAGSRLLLLFPGDELDVETALVSTPDNIAALDRFRMAEVELAKVIPDQPPTMTRIALEAAFASFSKSLHTYYPGFLIRAVGTMRFRVPDLGAVMVCDFVRQSAHFVPADAPADLEAYSQPLHFGFARTFGFETLAVSARFSVLNNRRRWRLLKIVSILNNQEIYLRPRHVTRRTISYIVRRLATGLVTQVRQKRRQRAAVMRKE